MLPDQHTHPEHAVHVPESRVQRWWWSSIPAKLVFFTWCNTALLHVVCVPYVGGLECTTRAGVVQHAPREVVALQ